MRVCGGGDGVACCYLVLCDLMGSGKARRGVGGEAGARRVGVYRMLCTNTTLISPFVLCVGSTHESSSGTTTKRDSATNIYVYVYTTIIRFEDIVVLHVTCFFWSNYAIFIVYYLTFLNVFCVADLSHVLFVRAIEPIHQCISIAYYYQGPINSWAVPESLGYY